MASWDIGGIIKSIAPAVVGLGAFLIQNNQNVQLAQGQANDAKALAELQYKTALANAQALALANQANANKNEPPPKNNTALYIGLGVGGVAFIGIVIFAVTRK
jgi:hypothetical protein